MCLVAHLLRLGLGDLWWRRTAKFSPCIIRAGEDEGKLDQRWVFMVEGKQTGEQIGPRRGCYWYLWGKKYSQYSYEYVSHVLNRRCNKPRNGKYGCLRTLISMLSYTRNMFNVTVKSKDWMPDTIFSHVECIGFKDDSRRGISLKTKCTDKDYWHSTRKEN